MRAPVCVYPGVWPVVRVCELNIGTFFVPVKADYDFRTYKADIERVRP